MVRCNTWIISHCYKNVTNMIASTRPYPNKDGVYPPLTVMDWTRVLVCIYAYISNTFQTIIMEEVGGFTPPYQCIIESPTPLALVFRTQTKISMVVQRSTELRWLSFVSFFYVSKLSICTPKRVLLSFFSLDPAFVSPSSFHVNENTNAAWRWLCVIERSLELLSA